MTFIENGIDTGGGPLILIPRSAIDRWRGYDDLDADPLALSHDYGRACAALNNSYATTIDVRGVDALVIECGSDAAYFHVHPAGVPMLVLWGGADSLEQLLSAADQLDLASPPDQRLTYEASENDLLLFDSAWPGDEESLAVMPVRLARGRYDLRIFSRSEHVWMTVLAFAR